MPSQTSAKCGCMFIHICVCFWQNMVPSLSKEIEMKEFVVHLFTWLYICNIICNTFIYTIRERERANGKHMTTAQLASLLGFLFRSCIIYCIHVCMVVGTFLKDFYSFLFSFSAYSEAYPWVGEGLKWESSFS